MQVQAGGPAKGTGPAAVGLLADTQSAVDTAVLVPAPSGQDRGGSPGVV